MRRHRRAITPDLADMVRVPLEAQRRLGGKEVPRTLRTAEWYDSHFSSRSGQDDMGSAGEGGVSGTVRLNDWWDVMQDVRKRMEALGKPEWTFFDVGMLNGRMPILAMAVAGCTYASGVELQGGARGPTRSQTAAGTQTSSAMATNFERVRADLNLCHKVSGVWRRDVRRVSYFTARPGVYDPTVLYMFFEGQGEDAMGHCYAVAAHSWFINIVVTVPNRTGKLYRNSKQIKAALRARGRPWEFASRHMVHMKSGSSVKDMMVFVCGQGMPRGPMSM